MEVDGYIHKEQRAYDDKREKELAALGFLVLRFTNDDVYKKIDDVIARIVSSKLPSPGGK